MAKAPEDAIPEGYVRESDVKAMIDLAMEQQTASLFEKLAAAAPMTVARPESDDDMSVFRKLALAIGEVSDQGTSRKRVSPEILEERERARERMVDLIAQARDRGELPVYTLKHKVYLDEMLIDPIWAGADKVPRPTEIGWPSVPSMAMTPVNQVAHAIYEQFEKSNGSVAPKVTPIMALTPGGVVIVKGMVPAPSAPQANAHQFGEGVTIRGRGMPGAIVEKRVLGTIAPAARQNA